MDFGDNVPAQTKQLSFVHDGSGQSLAWSLANPPVAFWVGQAYENSIATWLGPVWSYDFSKKLISVSFLKVNGDALTVGNSYKITVRIVP